MFVCGYINRGSRSAGGLTGVTALEKQSDIVLVATVQSITDTSAAEILTLQVQSVLKGQIGSLSAVVQFLPPGDMEMPSSGLLPKNVVGATGVWFLKLNGATYSVMPLATGIYTERDAYIGVAPADVSAQPTGTVDEQLLWYVVRWYQSLSGSDPGADARLFKSLDSANQADALAASTSLVNANSLDQQAIGLAAAIRQGSDNAVVTIGNRIQSLASSAKFSRVLEALGQFYGTPQSTSVPALQALAAQHLKIPGLVL
jgi:hypothetical protein